MIGLFAITCEDEHSLSRNAAVLTSTMRTNSSWDAHSWTGADVAAGRIGPARQGTVWTSQDGRRRAWLDGFASRMEGAAAQAETASAGDLADAVLSGGPHAMLGFQGEFFAIVYDGPAKRLYAIT